jgi:hypothetical protein
LPFDDPGKGEKYRIDITFQDIADLGHVREARSLRGLWAIDATPAKAPKSEMNAAGARNANEGRAYNDGGRLF